MKHLLLSVLLVVFALTCFAQDIPERPNPPRLVNDLANVLSNEEEQTLESELVEFDRSTTTQITIVTVPTLGDYEISDFAFQLGEKWGVGRKEKDNGIVIIFKPKVGNEKGGVFVAVGYGLEGIIPDAVANRTVVDKEMIPRFQQNDIYGGLYAGTKVLMGLASQEFTAQAYQKQAGGKESKDEGGGVGLIVVIIIIAILFSLFKGGRGRNFNAGGRAGSSLPFWIAMSLLGSGNRGGGSFGGFSGGGGGFGGGGGGFGGFGGGSFGGGGAGGSW